MAMKNGTAQHTLRDALELCEEFDGSMARLDIRMRLAGCIVPLREAINALDALDEVDGEVATR